jgi:hypothetical protein
LLGAQKWGAPALSAAVVCQPDHLFRFVIPCCWGFKIISGSLDCRYFRICFS